MITPSDFELAHALGWRPSLEGSRMHQWTKTIPGSDRQYFLSEPGSLPPEAALEIAEYRNSLKSYTDAFQRNR